MKSSPENSAELIIRCDGAVVSLEINRPEKRNSLSPDVLRGIVRALEKLKKDGSARCVVLSGRGGKAFSSGYDFSFVVPGDITRDYGGNKHPLAAACDAVENFPHPVLALVRGYAVGGGLELAAACDFIICSDDSKFSMPPSKLGIAYPFSGLRRIARAVGIANAKRMFFAAETFTAHQALQAGLVSEVTSPSAVEDTVYALARKIVSGAPLSIQAAKQGLNILAKSSKPSAKDSAAVRATLEKIGKSADFKEGMKSVAEKRTPVFKGR
ncbi:enoyl-CoA hydratase/isomerase family protein [Candidatus Mycalebacterium sp.]